MPTYIYDTKMTLLLIFLILRHAYLTSRNYECVVRIMLLRFTTTGPVSAVLGVVPVASPVEKLRKKIRLKLLKENSSEFSDPVATLIRDEPDEVDLETFLADLAIFERLLKMKRGGE